MLEQRSNASNDNAGVQNPTFAAKPSTSTYPMQISLEIGFCIRIPVRSILYRKVVIDNQSDLENEGDTLFTPNLAESKEKSKPIRDLLSQYEEIAI